MSDRKEIYLKYIDEICAKGDFDKEVLTFFVKNNGDINDIIEGISVVINAEGYISELLLPTVLKLKEEVIQNNSLYNIANYYILNNNKKIEGKEKEQGLNLFSIKNKTINNKIFMVGNYGKEKGSHLIIKLLMNDFVPNGCDYNLLDESDKGKLFNNFVKKIINLRFLNGECDYIIKMDINLTNCLSLNMVLIKNWIDNMCIGYINHAEELRENNKKYFTKQIIQRNISQF